MTNERFEELVHNLLAYDEARNVLKLSDVERDEFQNVIESRLHPTKLEMETPRGKLVLETDEDTLSTYLGFESNISGEFIDVVQVNYLNPDNSIDKDNFGELCVYTYGDAMEEDYTEKRIVENLKEYEYWQREEIERTFPHDEERVDD